MGPMPPAAVSQTDTGETEYDTPRNGAEVQAGHGALDHISITVAGNGFHVQCTYKSASRKGGSPDTMQPESSVFASPDELVAFLAKEVGAGAASDVQGESASAGAAAPPPPPMA